LRRRAAGRIEPADARRCYRPLLAYDGSPGAELALDFAIELASACHGRLTLVTATPQIPFLAYSGAAPEAVNEARRMQTRDAEHCLCDAVARVPQDVSVTKILSRRPIGDSLLREAARGEHDLLILGSRGRGVIRSALLGSLGRDMLRLSPLPVLIVEPSADRSREPDGLVPNPAPPMTPRSI
jgi:nucleotide-binding universal stress UspA family protein